MPKKAWFVGDGDCGVYIWAATRGKAKSTYRHFVDDLEFEYIVATRAPSKDAAIEAETCPVCGERMRTFHGSFYCDTCDGFECVCWGCGREFEREDEYQKYCPECR